jgi:hypothetical protein
LFFRAEDFVEGPQFTHLKVEVRAKKALCYKLMEDYQECKDHSAAALEIDNENLQALILLGGSSLIIGRR